MQIDTIERQTTEGLVVERIARGIKERNLLSVFNIPTLGARTFGTGFMVTADIRTSFTVPLDLRTLSIEDLRFAVLCRLGIDHTEIHGKYVGHHFRLMDDHGSVVKEILE